MQPVQEHAARQEDVQILSCQMLMGMRDTRILRRKYTSIDTESTLVESIEYVYILTYIYIYIYVSVYIEYAECLEYVAFVSFGLASEMAGILSVCWKACRPATTGQTLKLLCTQEILQHLGSPNNCN